MSVGELDLEPEQVPARFLLSESSFAVLDNVFPQIEFDQIWALVQDENYSFLNSHYWDKSSRLTDGRRLQGPLYFSEAEGNAGRPHSFPTQSAMDLLLKRIETISTELPHLLGQKGMDWDHFCARVTLLPAGSTRSWSKNTEAGGKQSFVYFAHPTWNVQWGGELLIAELGAARDREVRQTDSWLENARINDLLLARGLGHYVSPKPNRLVVLNSGVYHSTKRIDSNAGDNIHASISGTFFEDTWTNESL